MQILKQALRTLLSLCLACAGSAVAQASHAPEVTAKQPVVLLELFTSEGCSSCPPADALLRKLDRNVLSSGEFLIGLSEHVTYWNRLGWADPFSSETFTERQEGYRARFGLDSVYTPQLVINGDAQAVGSEPGEIASAIAAQGHAAPALNLKIVSSTVDGKGLHVNYSVLSDPPKGGVDLYAVIADDLDQSTVLRGENGGRTLSHAAVARSFIKLGRCRTAAERQQVTLPLTTLTRIGNDSRAGQHVVLFAQLPGYGRVLGADAQAIARP